MVTRAARLGPASGPGPGRGAGPGPPGPPGTAGAARAAGSVRASAAVGVVGASGASGTAVGAVGIVGAVRGLRGLRGRSGGRAGRVGRCPGAAGPGRWRGRGRRGRGRRGRRGRRGYGRAPRVGGGGAGVAFLEQIEVGADPEVLQGAGDAGGAQVQGALLDVLPGREDLVGGELAGDHPGVAGLFLEPADVGFAAGGFLALAGDVGIQLQDQFAGGVAEFTEGLAGGGARPGSRRPWPRRRR